MEDTVQSSSNLFPGLDAETMSALNAAEKNWNKEFKDGTLKQGLPGAAQNLAVATDFTAHAPQLITYVVSYVTESVTSYLASSISEMMSIDLGQIPAIAAASMPTFLVSAGTIMQELLTPKENIIEELTKAAEANVVDKLNEKIGDQVGKLQGSIQGKLDKVGDTIASIVNYASMGPLWVKSKIDLETKKIIESCYKEIGEKRDSLKSNMQESINTLGERMAQKMADKTNTDLQAATKAKLDEINKKKEEAATKAKTAITNAKLKLMALVGG